MDALLESGNGWVIAVFAFIWESIWDFWINADSWHSLVVILFVC